MNEDTFRDIINGILGIVALLVLIVCASIALPLAHEVFTVPR